MIKLKKKYPKLVGWSATRLAEYEECPLRTQLKYGEKVCPCCFSEVALSTYDKAVLAVDGTEVPPNSAYCTKKKKLIETPKPLKNGIEIGGGLEKYVDGTGPYPKKLSHPTVRRIADKLRAQHKAGKVTVEETFVLNDKWERVSQFTKGAWLRAKLDVLRILGNVAEVIDWKTGGIKNGQIRSSPKYQDQLNLYNTVVLSVDPDLERAESSLVFVEAPDDLDPVVAIEESDITQAQVKESQKKWSLKVVALLNDETFAPRPGYYCSWCSYSKLNNGGPCPVG